MDILVLCTGNQCRSPMAEVLLRRRLEEVAFEANVSSAGFLASGVPAHDGSGRAMATRGLDLSAHLSRTVTPEAIEGADLVLAMARNHVREAVLAMPTAWPRTFTLKELVRRGAEVGPRQPGEALDAWLARVHEGRNRGDLMGDDPADDVADPIGAPDHVFAATADEIAELVDRLVELAFPAVMPSPEPGR